MSGVAIPRIKKSRVAFLSDFVEGCVADMKTVNLISVFDSISGSDGSKLTFFVDVYNSSFGRELKIPDVTVSWR